MAQPLKEAIDSSKSEQPEKYSYVITQIEEMQAIIRRNEVDIYINEDIVWTDAEQEGVDDQIKKLKRENTKLAKAVESLVKLKSELEA